MNDIAPFVVASFDIECNSSTGKFPDANVIGDACFQIAITLCKFGSDEPYETTCLCYKNTSGENVTSYETERELLLAFKDYVQEKDIDIMTGWNIFGFDLDYIYKRAAMNKCGMDFYQLGKLKKHRVPRGALRSSQFPALWGTTFLKLLPMPWYASSLISFHEVKKGLQTGLLSA